MSPADRTEKLGRSNDSDAHHADETDCAGRWAGRAMTGSSASGCRDLFCWIFGKDSTAGSAGVLRTSGKEPAKRDVVLFTHLPDSASRLAFPTRLMGRKVGKGGIIEVGRNKGGTSRVVPVRLFFSVLWPVGPFQLHQGGHTHTSHKSISHIVLASCSLKLLRKTKQVPWNVDALLRRHHLSIVCSFARHSAFVLSQTKRGL